MQFEMDQIYHYFLHKTNKTFVLHLSTRELNYLLIPGAGGCMNTRQTVLLALE